MDDEHLLRFSRQIVLPEMDLQGQSSLASSAVLVVGIGALGTTVSEYLCRAGIGNLTLCDHDRIEVSNLPRQTLFHEDDIGKYKAEIASKRLNKINSDTETKTLVKEIDQKSLEDAIMQNYIIVDSTDNFTTRYLINEICYKRAGKLISGSALGWRGQIISFNFSNQDIPCYECCFGKDISEDLSCSEVGILGPVAGVIGCLLSIEVIKMILKLPIEKPFLRTYDFKEEVFNKISIRKDIKCKTCNHQKN
tara:strand:- start:61475 stop:62224 length:750 start_codon:yes stop_codon:yes gene_type:complete